MNLYVTADAVGRPNHGAGSVTHHESDALRSLGPCEVWGRERFQDRIDSYAIGEPWRWDEAAKVNMLAKDWSFGSTDVRDQTLPKLTHFYAGTFSNTVDTLKSNGCKVTYTAAAHSIEESKREHESLGIPYNYPHLDLKSAEWQRYVAGYLAADVLIVPSTHSADVMRSFGAREDRIRVIPHGVRITETVVSLPRTFTVGYLGNTYAADKGLRYLFAAWSKLNYKDAVLKVAGRDSTSNFTQQLWNTFGGKGNVHFVGWVKNVNEFYGSLSCYIQPSVTEGFGCEVTESQAAGRLCIASTGAGGCDAVPERYRFQPRDVDKLAELIDEAKRLDRSELERIGLERREAMKDYAWDEVRENYVAIWKELL